LHRKILIFILTAIKLLIVVVYGVQGYYNQSWNFLSAQSTNWYPSNAINFGKHIKYLDGHAH